MYEYARGALDEQREREMEEYISGCRDSQRELERLKRGMAYTASASQTQVSPALREALLNFEPHWQKQLRAWTLWSSQRGWRYLPYIFVLLTIASGLWVFKPWQPAVRDDIILAEQLKAEPDMIAPSTVPQVTPAESPEVKAAQVKAPEDPAPGAATPPTEVAATVPPSSAVTGAPTTMAPAPGAKVDMRLAQQDAAPKAFEFGKAPAILPMQPGVQTAPQPAQPTQVAQATPPPQPETKLLPPVPAANPPAATPTPPVPTVIKTAKTKAGVTEDASDDRAAAPVTARGFIMRGDVGVADFSNSWPAIRDKILALGGKVAGTVELGWLRRPDQSYFHFSLPESNLSEFELFLGTFGPVRFTKERHPRVMPEGQIRIILTVKDSITNEGTPETP